MSAFRSEFGAETPAATTLSPSCEMARLIREKDWSQTPIGPVEQWSPTLKIMVDFLLANRFPLLLWWGPQYGLKQAIEGRIRALALVHSLFVETRWIGADLSTIAAQELAPYSTKNESRIRVDGPPVLLEPNAAQAIAVTLHELATNATKYGALSGADGRVDLQWSHDADGLLKLRWMESGGPAVRPPTRKGFGGRIIEQVIAQQKGKTAFEWRKEGVVCEIAVQA